MHYLTQFFHVLFTPLRLLFTSPQKLIATPRKLLGLSLPARAAILLFLFLLVCVVSACAILYLNRDTYDMPWWRNLPVILLLMVVIPVVTYQALRLWLEGGVSEFEDIDRAWKAGLDALERQGLDLTQVPLFLVLGSSSPRQEKAVFEASRLELSVANVPTGPAALHWYANPDGIYLVASGVGSLSKLASLGEAAAEERAGEAPPSRAAEGMADLGRKAGDIRQTMTAGAPAPAARSMPQPNIRGTMMIRQTMDPSESATAAAAPAEKRHIKLSRDDVEAQPKRLEYLCRLIRRARQPLCPVNGVMTLLPYAVIQWGAAEGVEVQKAIRADVTTLGREFKLRFPVTALVVGLESEAGFRELVQRVGRDRARAQRFGKGFGVWDPATPEQLEALGAHACGAFEDWVYTLFREPEALDKPGNTRLYSLLCKIRRTLQSRLDGILVGGYSHDPEAGQRADSVLMGGCYFAATGDNEDRQAFIKSVFDKLPEQQEELEWLPEALAEDGRYRAMAYAGFALNAALLALLVGLVYFKLKA